MRWAVFILFMGFRPASAEVKFSADVYLSHAESEIEPTALNPGNILLELPHSKTDIDLRPEIKLRESAWQAVLRPRLIDSFRQVSKSGANQQISKSNTDITDAFIENNWI